jgi:2-(1,2-epoxy-1,2-dihydrophenyl)acetyl-CoA isomerase
MSDVMSESVLLLEKKGPVATLTLNRPKSKNALDQALIDALGPALKEVAEDPSVRAIVLTGAGGAFCSGADLKAGMMGTGNPTALIDQLHAIVRLLANTPKPIIAAIDGAAVGYGADLALACDLRVLSTRGYLQEIFVRIGLMPDGGGTFWLQRLVGTGRAMEYLMLGTKLDAELCERLGMANRVVAPDSLLASAQEFAAELAKGPPLAIAHIKQSVRASAQGGLDQALLREKTNQLKLLASSDLMEGVAAWAQKRTPEFKGE